jgi:predicted nucleic acid-binding protein
MIMDEPRGRREAENRGFTVIGTLGVLKEAAGEGLLELRLAIERLRQTNFHISNAVLAKLFQAGLDDLR